MAERPSGYGYKPEMVAKYRCPSCNNKWKKKNSSGRPGRCERCATTVSAYKYRPAKPNEVVRGRSRRTGPRKMFGEFFCSRCERTWLSGNAWEGMGQQCLDCKRRVLPRSLRPLQFQGGTPDNKKPHVQELCEMCKMLGFSCVDYVPPTVPPSQEDKEEDYPDDVSVVSSSSSTSSASTASSQIGDVDGETTPIPSDEEENAHDALLDKVLKWNIKDCKPE